MSDGEQPWGRLRHQQYLGSHLLEILSVAHITDSAPSQGIIHGRRWCRQVTNEPATQGLDWIVRIAVLGRRSHSIILSSISQDSAVSEFRPLAVVSSPSSSVLFEHGSEPEGSKAVSESVTRQVAPPRPARVNGRSFLRNDMNFNLEPE